MVFVMHRVLWFAFICVSQSFLVPARQTSAVWRAVQQSADCTSFGAYQLPQWLIGACGDLGYLKPTAVQKLALPAVLNGADVILQAQTGSGKTLAYALPLLARVDATRASIQAVVVVPTRELGQQVASILKQLSVGAAAPISIMSVVDGSKNRRQMIWATAEPPHVVVGNPSSLQKLVDAGKLRINAVDMVVIDEVDACLIEPDTRLELHNLLTRHLSSTFTTVADELQEDQRESRVFRDLAKDQVRSKYRLKRQTVMCSATIPQRQHFAVQCYKNGWTNTMPELINVSQDTLVPAQVLHEHIHCPAELRRACLRYLLKAEFAGADSVEGARQAIVFVRSPDEVAATSQFLALEKAGTAAERSRNIGVLEESMSLDARAKAVSDFRTGQSQVLVCSDLGARGLDLPNTALVIQMNLPDRVEGYIHRAGRTGRLGRPGKVITLTSPEEGFVVKRFGNDIGVPITERKLNVKAALK